MSQVVLDTAGMDLRNSSGTSLAKYGAITRIGLVAAEHISASSAGITIKDGTTERAVFAADSTVTGGTITLRSSDNNNDKFVLTQNKAELFDNDTSVASFGAVTRIGDVANEHISASSAGITLKDGSNQLGVFNAGGLTVGKTTGAHISMSLNELNMYAYDDNESAVYKRVMIGNVAADGDVAGIALGGVVDADVTMASTDNVVRITPASGIKMFQSSTNFAHMNQNGLRVYRGSASNPVATFGATAHIGRTDGTNNNVFIDSDSVDIRRGAQISASFGITDTTIGSTIGKHIKINSTALEIKTNANTTALSASAAGLEMSGKIKATGGTIGGNTLTSGSIFSGTGTFGNANTPFFLDSGGRFSLKNKLSFNGSTLSVNGTITSENGTIGDWEIGDKKIFYAESGTDRLRLDALSGDLQIDGDDAVGIVLGNATGGGGSMQMLSNTSIPLFFGVKEDGTRSVFRVGSAGSFLKFDTGTGFEVSSSNFHLDTSGNTTMAGKITSTEGTIGGWSMTTSSFFSGDTGDRMEFQSNNNRIVLYDAAKSSLAGDELIQIGQLSSAGEVVFGSSVYGIKISGSNSSMGSNEAKLVGQMGDHGATATNFHYTSSVIQGYSKSRNPNNIYGGRAGIYGRSSFALSSIPAGYIGSLSSQKGIMAGIVGSHLNHGSGFYRKTAGILGVNNQNLLDDVGFPKKIATGSFGVVSVGPMYVTASTADHREAGIGYSILAGGGYVHVSASSAGNFGGIGSGIIIDSSNTSGTSAGLRLVSDSSNTTEITSNGAGVQINKGVINTTGDSSFSGSYFGSSGTFNTLDGGVIATRFARNGSVGVTINHSAGSITANGNLDVGGTYTNNTQPAFLAFDSTTDNNIDASSDYKVEFDSVVYDQASNFSTTNDEFSAPVTGRYLLTTQLRLDDIDTAATWLSIRIVTSNREYRRFIDPNFSADLNQFGMNMTVVADMDAGDTAHVEILQNGGSNQIDVDAGNPGSNPKQFDKFFCGYLLG